MILVTIYSKTEQPGVSAEPLRQAVQDYEVVVTAALAGIDLEATNESNGAAQWKYLRRRVHYATYVHDHLQDRLVERHLR